MLHCAGRELRCFASIITSLKATQLRICDSIPCKHKRILCFVFSKASRQALQFLRPPRQWIPGLHTPRVKWPGCEAVHSPPFSAEVRISGSIPPLWHVLHGMHGPSFTVYWVRFWILYYYLIFTRCQLLIAIYEHVAY